MLLPQAYADFIEVGELPTIEVTVLDNEPLKKLTFFLRLVSASLHEKATFEPQTRNHEAEQNVTMIYNACTVKLNKRQEAAKAFLLRAKASLTDGSSQWKVNFQWHKHLYRFSDGSVRAIPRRLAKQLKLIDDTLALDNGDYIKAKEAFFAIGRESDSFFTKRSTSKYFALFKSDSADEQVEQFFQPSTLST